MIFGATELHITHYFYYQTSAKQWRDTVEFTTNKLPHFVANNVDVNRIPTQKQISRLHD